MISEHYNTMLKKSKLLPREETQALLKEYFDLKDKKDAKSRRIADRIKQRIVVGNLRLIPRHIAKRWSSHGEYEDMLQEGVFGLMRAVEKFDPRKGYMFSTYATTWVRAFTNRYVNEKAYNIRMPDYVRTHMSCVAKTRQVFETEHGRQPMLDELYEIVKKINKETTMCKIKTAVESENIRTTSGDVSLAARGYDGRTLFDLIETHDQPRDEEKEAAINRLNIALKKLEPREKEIIVRRFGLDGKEEETLKELADRLSLSRERVRQIQNRTIFTLGKIMSKHLKLAKLDFDIAYTRPLTQAPAGFPKYELEKYD